MKKILRNVTYVVLAIIVLMAFIAAKNAVVTEDIAIWQVLGVFTLVPPLVAIVLAFLTHNVILSLFSGVFTGTIMVSFVNIKGNIFVIIGNAFMNLISTMVGSMADKWNAGILLQVMAIGGVVALIAKMGGTYAVANKLAGSAKTARKSQFITWVLGLFVFFDDYANSLIVGPIMRPVTDEQKISREKFSFIVDATAAPISGIALVSTWIGYELSLIKGELPGINVSESAYSIFIQTIPYRAYNIFILVFIVATIVLLREFGPMYKAEKRARTTGKVLADGATPLAMDDSMKIDKAMIEKANIWNAIIPIAVLILSALVGFYLDGYQTLKAAASAVEAGAADINLFNMISSSPVSLDAIRECYAASDASIVLFMSAVLAGIVALILGKAQKLFTIQEGLNTWVDGWKNMVITLIILLFAWSIADVIKNQLDADMFLATTLSNALPAFIIPTIIFILGSIISFATGTSYGTMGILMPLAIPLANMSSNGDMGLIVAAIAAVLTGAIFGDHCSPISDTTILSSMGTACDHIDHVKTQIVYALVVAGVSIVFGFLPAGLGVSPMITLPLGMAVIFAIIRFVGKPV